MGCVRLSGKRPSRYFAQKGATGGVSVVGQRVTNLEKSAENYFVWILLQESDGGMTGTGDHA